MLYPRSPSSDVCPIPEDGDENGNTEDVFGELTITPRRVHSSTVVGLLLPTAWMHVALQREKKNDEIPWGVFFWRVTSSLNERS